MNIAQNIKTQINTQLAALVTAGSLGSYISMDAGKDPLTEDVGAWPVAMVSMPQLTSAFEDTANNLRTYRFDILFMNLTDNIVDGAMETLMDRVTDAFDTNLTLNGVAEGAMLPAEVLAWPVSSGGKTYACFIVTIKARALYTVGS